MFDATCLQTPRQVTISVDAEFPHHCAFDLVLISFAEARPPLFTRCLRHSISPKVTMLVPAARVMNCRPPIE